MRFKVGQNPQNVHIHLLTDIHVRVQYKTSPPPPMGFRDNMLRIWQD